MIVNVYFYGLQNSHHPLLEVYAHDFRNNKSQKKTPAASDRCSTINYLFFIKTNTEFLNSNSPNWNLRMFNKLECLGLFIQLSKVSREECNQSSHSKHSMRRSPHLCKASEGILPLQPSWKPDKQDYLHNVFFGVQVV